MTDWSLPKLLSGLHEDIHHRLQLVRGNFAHTGTKGDGSENVWLTLLQTYLPKRYQSERAFVVDSKGQFSEQIDIVVFDRQYSPFIFCYEGQFIVPAESVYAAFEAKQSATAGHVSYAQTKVASVRQLHRTSLPIPHAGGTYPPKPAIPIIGGLVTFGSEWTPPLGDALESALHREQNAGFLDLGCIAEHGHFSYDHDSERYSFAPGGKPATAFLFDLISRLQGSGTVPMIDIQAYARWLA